MASALTKTFIGAMALIGVHSAHADEPGTNAIPAVPGTVETTIRSKNPNPDDTFTKQIELFGCTEEHIGFAIDIGTSDTAINKMLTAGLHDKFPALPKNLEFGTPEFGGYLAGHQAVAEEIMNYASQLNQIILQKVALASYPPEQQQTTPEKPGNTLEDLRGYMTAQYNAMVERVLKATNVPMEVHMVIVPDACSVQLKGQVPEGGKPAPRPPNTYT